MDGIRGKSNRDIDRPRALRFDKDHQRIFDENPEVVVCVLRNDALARNRFDIGLADGLIFWMQSLVHFYLILGNGKQVREHAVFRVSLRPLLKFDFARFDLLLWGFLCYSFCHNTLHLAGRHWGLCRHSGL